MAGFGLFLVSMLDDLVEIVKVRPEFVGLGFAAMFAMLLTTMRLISDVTQVLEG